MAKLPFDFKGFSKVSADDNHTVMRNKQGHEIKIVHKALSKESRDQLSKLPMSQDKDKPEAAKGAKQPAKMANGGTVKSTYDDRPKAAYDEGGEVQKNAEQISSGANMSEGQYNEFREKKQQDRPAVQKTSNGNTIQSFDDGGAVAPTPQDAPASDAAKQLDNGDSAAGTPITINIGQPQSLPNTFNNPFPGRDAHDFASRNGDPVKDLLPPTNDMPLAPPKEAQLAQYAQQGIIPGAEQPGAPGPAPAQPGLPDASQTPQANPDPYGMDAYGNALNQGVAEQKAGMVGEAQAIGQQGAQQAHALSQMAGQQQQQLKTYQEHYSELDNERQAFQHDLQNEHIDPKHYWSSQSTGSKIATGIGLILGGMGSGVTGGENPALSFLNKQIDRDIEAQKSELGKKENLLTANLKQFGNMRDAMDMTRIMQNDIVMNKLKQAAATAAGPLAQAQSLKAIGALDTQTAQLQQQLAVRKTMVGALSQVGTDPAQMGQVIQAMRQFNPEMAKSMEERYVPGVGIAQVPVPQAARDTIIAKQQLHQMASDFYNWSQKHSGSVDPAVVNEGKTKAAELQSLYRNSINGGVFKKGEQEFIDNIIDSDPTKFFNSIRVLPKLKEVMNNNIQQLNTLKRGYGISVPEIKTSAPILKR